eukprot:NODE_1053_length_619_cov_60.210526_g981_i0.p2 GENE.NODE_1053_length_619_cov_60.210526_g981_i0~~NODE_1053_length_619_cov_60.210526_g981_i0.p2  ORF type:complete len:62 (+),score=12.49 NODE_1053_length_619_cov_60.210526_g981_i0:196-381(+)
MVCVAWVCVCCVCVRGFAPVLFFFHFSGFWDLVEISRKIPEKTGKNGHLSPGSYKKISVES